MPKTSHAPAYAVKANTTSPFYQSYAKLRKYIQIYAFLLLASCFIKTAQGKSLVFASNPPCGELYGCEPTRYSPRSHDLSTG